jgi:hypothetical protein
MKIKINKQLLKSIDNDFSKIEYLLDWCTGYIHRNQIQKVKEFSIELSSLMKNTTEVDISDSTINDIKTKYRCDLNNLTLVTNLLLLSAILLGEGE